MSSLFACVMSFFLSFPPRFQFSFPPPPPPHPHLPILALEGELPTRTLYSFFCELEKEATHDAQLMMQSSSVSPLGKKGESDPRIRHPELTQGIT